MKQLSNNRIRVILGLCVLLFAGGCSFKSASERADETRQRMEKLATAFVIHYAFEQGRAASAQEVVEVLLQDDSEPLPADTAGKITQRMTHDLWDQPIAFEYVEQPNGLYVELSSGGPDKKIGTGDDIAVEQVIVSYPDPVGE